MAKIAIVVPAYCEGPNIIPLYKELLKTCNPIEKHSWTFVFVNDGSSDSTLEVLREIAAGDERVKVIDLSRNFGKEVALTAGVHAVNEQADAVVCMDADLQHPPRLIPELLQHWQDGAEIVATVRTGTKNKSLARKLSSHLYYWIMRKISGIDIVSQSTDFRLYDRKVIAAFSKATERERMFRGIMDWLGFRKVYVEFEADARREGLANYSYSKLWALAINSITSFSLWPLRLTGYLGLLITSISTVGFLVMVISVLFLDPASYSPLAFVVVLNTFLIGVVLMAIGLVALYIGTIHTEVVNRPLYVVRETINLEESGSPDSR